MLPELSTAAPGFDTDEQRWLAVLQRDRRARGCFVYAVRSTGIYCHPDCPARRPLRENTVFFAHAAVAAAAGFRPCRRCHAEQDDAAQVIAALCQCLDDALEIPTLAELAARVGLSGGHVQRVFKRATGLSPRQYAMQRRAERAKVLLRGGERVTDALYGAGFNSSSQFYDAAGPQLGMAPGAFRAGGRGQRINHALCACALGWVLIAATARGVCAVHFGDQPEALLEVLRAEFPEAELVEGGAEFSVWVAAVLRQIEQPAQPLTVPLDVVGSVFQMRVWAALRDIAPGQTRSYAQLALAIGQPRAVRAVAHACACNGLALLIPCHRVVRGDGSLAGYRWGLARKALLLRREQGGV